MKYLLQAIEAKRSSIRLNDADLRKLLTEVRKGRDEREEFLESIDRILTELRNYSEHSAAFLSKVSKRDAPDYYDVIKHPMDLATMQKKVKAGQYKSKKQFAHDLGLIWENCLKYNTDPSHPLRRNVHFMRKKADHLLEFISDKSDVKDALMQWEANEAARTAQINDSKGKNDATPDELAVPTSYGFGTAGRMGSPAAISLDKQGSRFSAAPKRQDPLSVPFDQRPAYLRTADAMTIFASLDQSLAWTEASSIAPMLGLAAAPTMDDGNVGHSRRPMRAVLNVPTNQEAGDLTKACATMEGFKEHTSLDPLSATLKGVFRSTSLKGKERATPEPPVHVDFLEASACWWTACTSDVLMAAGLPQLPAYGRPGLAIDDPGLSEDHSRRRKRRRRVPPTQRPGLQGQIARNIRTIQKVQETHTKFLNLAHVVESEAPIPAYLTHISSDEELDDYPSGAEDVDGGEPLDAYLDRNPLARISPDLAREHLAHHTKTILAHHGFEGGHRAPVDVLTDVMAEFLMNIGRTMRIYSDRYANKMSAEEMILHTLLESGNTDVAGLETYIRDDVERYGGKMGDLLRKLRHSYKEQLTQSAERGILEDDALFADGGEALVSGNFAEGLGDDFFGFREMGLDQEFGISGLTVPSRLFHGRGTARAATAAKDVPKEEALPYPPPPPYVPLTSSAIPAQIGLLQGWYRDKFRQRRAMSKPAEVEEDAEAWASTLPDEEQGRQKYKVPPTGKLPNRLMWTPGWAQKALAKATAAAANGDGGGGGGGAGDGVAAAGGPQPSAGSKGGRKSGGAKRKRIGSSVAA